MKTYHRSTSSWVFTQSVSSALFLVLPFTSFISSGPGPPCPFTISHLYVLHLSFTGYRLLLLPMLLSLKMHHQIHQYLRFTVLSATLPMASFLASSLPLQVNFLLENGELNKLILEHGSVIGLTLLATLDLPSFFQELKLSACT